MISAVSIYEIKLCSLFQKMAGGEYLGFNNSIFLSERDSADRNNALAYFMRENHCFPPGDIKINDVLDFYFQVTNDYVISHFIKKLFTRDMKDHL